MDATAVQHQGGGPRPVHAEPGRAKEAVLDPYQPDAGGRRARRQPGRHHRRPDRGIAARRRASRIAVEPRMTIRGCPDWLASAASMARCLNHSIPVQATIRRFAASACRQAASWAIPAPRSRAGPGRGPPSGSPPAVRRRRPPAPRRPRAPRRRAAPAPRPPRPAAPSSATACAVRRQGRAASRAPAARAAPGARRGQDRPAPLGASGSSATSTGRPSTAASVARAAAARAGSPGSSTSTASPAAGRNGGPPIRKARRPADPRRAQPGHHLALPHRGPPPPARGRPARRRARQGAMRWAAATGAQAAPKRGARNRPSSWEAAPATFGKKASILAA